MRAGLTHQVQTLQFLIRRPKLQDAIEWEELRHEHAQRPMKHSKAPTASAGCRRREQQHMEDVARVAEVRQLLEKLAV